MRVHEEALAAHATRRSVSDGHVGGHPLGQPAAPVCWLRTRRWCNNSNGSAPLGGAAFVFRARGQAWRASGSRRGRLRWRRWRWSATALRCCCHLSSTARPRALSKPATMLARSTRMTCQLVRPTCHSSHPIWPQSILRSLSAINARVLVPSRACYGA